MDELKEIRKQVIDYLFDNGFLKYELTPFSRAEGAKGGYYMKKIYVDENAPDTVDVPITQDGSAGIVKIDMSVYKGGKID